MVVSGHQFFIVTLSEPALGPCAFFVYLRALFSFFFLNISSWLLHRPPSPISPKQNPHALPSRLVLQLRRLSPYQWPKLRKPNNKVSRNIFVKVNIFFPLGGNRSDIELEQMKMENLSRTIVGGFFFSGFDLFT
jgi:hypothetical protein